MNTRNDRHVAESERNDATIATFGRNIFEKWKTEKWLCSVDPGT